MIEGSYLQHHLLIAMPGMSDRNFSQTVTYLCEHNADGALGIIVNRPSDLRLSQLMDQMQLPGPEQPEWDTVVYHGGPVNEERGFVLHEEPGPWDASLFVSEAMHVTTSRDILTAIAKGQGPSRYLVALGYAGWGAGQLEQEMRDNAWLAVPSSSSILFDLPAPERLAAAIGLLGVDWRQLSSEAGHA
ncbi:YqgE/AlgH family protein [Candidatus Macondimonas diazotrophica]|jgi:putative transcriptional regulator|uniref:UPF0301 protein E4680_03750 n=1 Tax=Candidatus Macondimonas diazotrophica TaxID=2305248 RepID=A0A4Z0FCQ2_9GAMM|nr:YqgE/AlgH family protein [Candidatus Macondimonas diazotrophica]MDY6956850.1 YqgE/AlgH family protein [Pseudomonadota bacterium]HBG30266.1 YqgE/AlgH family protein [Gammaproteobacteria bacterium]NCU01426.1 YqgE/AlgH family protein [Candidatus Macondimonas diazotrophica]TFZ83621.1 YqgE/AlgH family protein [Candidatus Macondimonas diazotrophica]HBG50397.1 YqgE/AlgH family protein [Gammaproteobacteria bacterium]